METKDYNGSEERYSEYDAEAIQKQYEENLRIELMGGSPADSEISQYHLKEKDYSDYFKAFKAFKEKYRNVTILNRDNFEYTAMRPNAEERNLFTKDEWQVFKDYYKELSEIEARIDSPFPPKMLDQLLIVNEDKLDCLNKSLEIELEERLRNESLKLNNVLKEESDDEVLLRMIESGAIKFSAKRVTEADQEYYSVLRPNIKDESLSNKKDMSSLAWYYVRYQELETEAWERLNSESYKAKSATKEKVDFDCDDDSPWLRMSLEDKEKAIKEVQDDLDNEYFKAKMDLKIQDYSDYFKAYRENLDHFKDIRDVPGFVMAREKIQGRPDNPFPPKMYRELIRTGNFDLIYQKLEAEVLQNQSLKPKNILGKRDNNDLLKEDKIEEKQKIDNKPKFKFNL